MDKLELFNALITVVTPVNSMGAHADSLDQPLAETGLDSLDLLMMAIYLSDLWGAPEEAVKDMQPVTVGDMIDYIIAHKTKEPPATIAEALELVS
jgi:acyl carrier protein